MTVLPMGGKFERAEIYHAHEGFINWCKEKAPELLDCEGISRIESDFDSYENNLKPEVMQFDQAICVATTMRCLFGTKGALDSDRQQHWKATACSSWMARRSLSTDKIRPIGLRQEGQSFWANWPIDSPVHPAKVR